MLNLLNFKTNKITDIRETYLAELRTIYPSNEAAALLDMIFEHRLGITRVERTISPDRRLSESDMLLVHFDVKELKKFRPIQYIFGEMQFYDLNIAVNENVLIPRPETEELVQWIVEQNKEKVAISILDIGTGTGCIALALKRNFPGGNIDGCDLSAVALEVANRNAESNSLKVNFFQMDILNESEWGRSQKVFDVIVCNPPYVTESDKKMMSANVLNFEPPLALYVSDADPLIFYRNIFNFADQHLKPGGKVYLEINQQFGRELSLMAVDFGFSAVELRKDLSGNDRMLSATKPNF